MAPHAERWPVTGSSSFADLALAPAKINMLGSSSSVGQRCSGKVVTIAVVALALDVNEPWVSFAAFIGFEVFVNVALSAWCLRSSTPAAWPSGDGPRLVL